MNIKVFVLLAFSSISYASTQYVETFDVKGADVEAAKIVFDRTYEAAEVCDYALRVSKQYEDCHEFYNLAVGSSGYQNLNQEILSAERNGGPKSEFLIALVTVHVYNQSLKSNNETDPDFSRWWQQYYKKLIGVSNVDLLLYQARVGGLYVPAN